MDVGARELTRDPSRSPVGRGDATIEGGRQLDDDVGTAGATVMQIGRELAFGGRGGDADARRRGPRPAGARCRGRRRSDRDPRPPRRRARRRLRAACARRGIAVVVAGLERHVGGRALGAVTRGGECDRLRVLPDAGRTGRALAHDLAVADEHAPDPRPRRRAAASPGRRRGRVHQLGIARGRALRVRRARAHKPRLVLSGRGDDDRRRHEPMRRSPSPIRTVTVGPGLAPGRRTTGGRAFAGFRFPASPVATVTAGRDFHPNPEGCVFGCLRRNDVRNRQRFRFQAMPGLPKMQRVQFWAGRPRRRSVGKTVGHVRARLRAPGQRQDDGCRAPRGGARPPHARPRLDQGVPLGRARRGRPGVVAPARRSLGRHLLAPGRGDAGRRARQLLPPGLHPPDRGAARPRDRGALRVSARARARPLHEPPAAPVPLRPLLRRRHVRPVAPSDSGPLALGGPLLEVDTTRPVDIHAIATWVREANPV